jgi:hypothetical protein
MDETRSAAEAPPRIFRIRYRSAVTGKVAQAYAKIPYGGLFALTDFLDRMVATRQVRWFRIDVASGAEIAEHRLALARWPQALALTYDRTRINPEA